MFFLVGLSFPAASLTSLIDTAPGLPPPPDLKLALLSLISDLIALRSLPFSLHNYATVTPATMAIHENRLETRRLPRGPGLQIDADGGCAFRHGLNLGFSSQVSEADPIGGTEGSPSVCI